MGFRCGSLSLRFLMLRRSAHSHSVRRPPLRGASLQACECRLWRHRPDSTVGDRRYSRNADAFSRHESIGIENAQHQDLRFGLPGSGGSPQPTRRPGTQRPQAAPRGGFTQRLGLVPRVAFAGLRRHSMARPPGGQPTRCPGTQRPQAAPRARAPRLSRIAAAAIRCAAAAPRRPRPPGRRPLAARTNLWLRPRLRKPAGAMDGPAGANHSIPPCVRHGVMCDGWSRNQIRSHSSVIARRSSDV